MKTINKCLNKEEFQKYIFSKRFTRKIDKIVLHHTWDTIEDWQKGRVSCDYYKKMYEGKGWKAGPHLFIAPEGIWLFTDINKQGRHANKGNKGSIGIEMVGRYDGKIPSGRIWQNTKSVLKVLLERFDLSFKSIHFHREYNPNKTCPGKAVTKKWLKEQIC